MIDNLFLGDYSQGEPIFDDVLTFAETVEFFELHSGSEVTNVSPVKPYKGTDKETGLEATYRWVRFKLANGKRIGIHCGPSADALLDEREGAKKLSFGITYTGKGKAKKVDKLFGFVASTLEDDWMEL